MPEKIALWYDWMDALENYDYALMTDEELKENQQMYYSMAVQEFPEVPLPY